MDHGAHAKRSAKYRNTDYTMGNGFHLDQVVIRGLHFMSCSNQIEHVSQVTIEDSRLFGGEKLFGTALELVETSANIVQCSIITTPLEVIEILLEFLK